MREEKKVKINVEQDPETQKDQVGIIADKPIEATIKLKDPNIGVDISVTTEGRSSSSSSSVGTTNSVGETEDISTTAAGDTTSSSSANSSFLPPKSSGIEEHAPGLSNSTSEAAQPFSQRPSTTLPQSQIGNQSDAGDVPTSDPQTRANNAQNVSGVNPYRDRDYNNRRNQEIDRQVKAGKEDELGGEPVKKDPTNKNGYHSSSSVPGDSAENSKKEKLRSQVEEAKRKGAAFNQKKNEILHPIQTYKNKQKIKKQKQRARRIQAAKTWIKTHPVETAVIVGIIILVAIFIMMILVILLSGEGQGSADTKAGWNCTYSAGSQTYEDLQVELVNCNATKSSYQVLETISFEQYVLGVALAEAGESTSDEALKAQMIAVRNFALNRNKTMCPSNPDNCFYGYNSESNTIRMRACTNDQVYWDYTEDIYRVPQSVALYSPEVNSSTPGAVLWKKALSEERQAEVEALASEVVGKTLTDANGNISNIDFTSVETDKFIALANSGQDYTQILLNVYGTNNTISSSTCDYSETAEGVVASGDYANWRQTDPRWSSTRIGSCTLGKVGCLITAVSIQVARSGAKTTLPEFNPGTFASALNRNGGVASNCNFMGVNYVKKIVPSISQPYNDRIYGYSKSQILSYVKKRIDEGCHLVIEVKGHGTKSSVGQHWVAIDDLSTKNSNYTKLYMWDPSTKSTDLFAKYGNRITVAKCFKFN